MFKHLRSKVAKWLAPEWEEGVLRMAFDVDRKMLEVDSVANQRVADILSKMDPFEPFFKKYHVIFSTEYERVEDKLNEQSRIQLFQWAYGLHRDPSFIHLVDWIRNTQGNATLRKARNDNEWFYGRAAVTVMTSFVDEVGRLSSRYEELLAKDHPFDPSLPVE